MPEPMKLAFGDHDDPKRELSALFGGEELAVSWARGILDLAGVNPAQELEAIATLRRTEPRLSLRPARYLAEQLGTKLH